MDLSIVTTLYRSAPYVREFHRRASSAARLLTDDYEIVYVNDGSPDESLDLAIGVFLEDRHVRIIDLSRNFGHHKAMMTGLAESCGELVFLVDSDLEEEPEWLTDFHREMASSDIDVVYGVQETRKGSVFERWSGALYYTLFAYLTNYPVPRNVVTARLMTRRYVEGLVRHRDQEVFMLGLWSITGFRQVPLIVRKHESSLTTYTLAHKVSVFVNSVTSFSNKPLVLVFYLGCFVSAVAGLATVYTIIRRLFFQELLAGWVSVIVSIWLLGGLILLSLGIIGVYVAKIYSETKPRPYTLIRTAYEHDTTEGSE